ncbi:MAG: carbohydrate kinase, partial [Cellulomonadaceae bacterium]|nr:carbohydrate kinase [Cellulomonadaceae bacterium]
MAQVDPVDAPVCLAVATEPTPAEADALVAAVVRLAAQVIARTGLRPAAVGIASMAETGVALDADGRPLTPLLRWDGHRAGTQADALAASLGRAELFAATGVRASAKVPLATWAWLADHEPAVHAEMATWVGVADLLALVLTGRAVTDHTLAGRTMAFRLPGPDGALPTSFDAELLAAVGLRPSTLPQVLGPGEVAGVVPGPSDGPRGHRHWAAACGALRDAGLAAGTPVVVAGHDHAVGTWAGGARTPGDRVDSVGTAEAVLSVLPGAPDPDRTAAAGMSSVITVGGGHAVLAGTSSAGAMLGWLAERTGQDPGVLLAAAHLDLVADPAPTGVLVLPYLAGRQTP